MIVFALFGGLLAGCESTQTKSARLKAQAKVVEQEEGLSVTAENPDVKVLSTAVLTDDNGSAAIVELRNESPSPQALVPLAIDVRDASGASVFKNDAPGIDPALSHAPLLEPGDVQVWVHDQVLAAGEPASVEAKVGMPEQRVAGRLPRIDVESAGLESDETSGTFARGYVRNRSKVSQRGLVVLGVARRGAKVVAAGRAQLRLVRPGARTSFRMYFIGDPSGAELELWAPPSVLAEAR